MDWCVADSFERANHNPVVAVQGDRSGAVAQVRAAPGQRVNLSAAGTRDPDGDTVSYRWFVYPEAGTFRDDVRIEEAASPQAWFLAPQVVEPGVVARHIGGVGRRSASPVPLSPHHRHGREYTGMRSHYVLLLVVCLGGGPVCGAGRGLTDTSASPHVRLRSVEMDAVRWTDGFWAGRLEWCRKTVIPNMGRLLEDPNISHAYENFLVAAGRKQGRHHGPKWNDGDFFKWLEAMAFVYATTRDEDLNRQMDGIIEVIGQAQGEDGYLHTPAIIAQRQNLPGADGFDDRLDFETYNMGHLMTCACVHYRATGKTSLLEIAKKAAEFLYRTYQNSPDTLANNAICPSHYMGVVEMYRTTGDPRYLELARGLIDIRDRVQGGTDDNQDRIPFRRQTQAVGHAVRANYLYAGAADVYAETGDASLLSALEKIWQDVALRKMYVTGATRRSVQWGLARRLEGSVVDSARAPGLRPAVPVAQPHGPQ